MPGEVTLWKGVVGFRENLKVGGNKPSEPLMVSVGTATTVGVVTSARENRADMALKIPVVAEPGQRVAVSRRIGGEGRLIRYGGLECTTEVLRLRFSQAGPHPFSGRPAEVGNRTASSTLVCRPGNATP